MSNAPIHQRWGPTTETTGSLPDRLKCGPLAQPRHHLGRTPHGNQHGDPGQPPKPDLNPRVQGVHGHAELDRPRQLLPVDVVVTHVVLPGARCSATPKGCLLVAPTSTR